FVRPPDSTPFRMTKQFPGLPPLIASQASAEPRGANLGHRKSLGFGLLELQARLVLLEELAELVGLVEQANPLFVVQGDRKAAEAVNADAALLAHFKVDRARTARLGLFLQCCQLRL